MDLFEALKEGGRQNYQREHPFQPYTEGAASAIKATIEALKEMMVGRRKRARISWHTKPDGEQWTLVRCWDAEAITLDGHHGTDGEEVYVLVVRVDEPIQDSKEGS